MSGRRRIAMIAGIRDGRAEKRLFRHNDLHDLACILVSLPRSRPKPVCFE
jgi:5-aminolevulinate synthase